MMLLRYFLAVAAMLAALPLLRADDCGCSPARAQLPRARGYQGVSATNWKPCQFHFNVMDRWDGNHPLIQPDTRPNEFWYHTPTAAKHMMNFTKVPEGRRVRIVGFDLNVVARFTGRDGVRLDWLGYAKWIFGQGTPWEDRYPSGWAFIALHTGDDSLSTTITEPHVGRDLILWEQMPVAEQRHNFVRPWRDDSIINGLLFGGALELRQGMFNWSGHEAQIETTGEFFFCYQER